MRGGRRAGAGRKRGPDKVLMNFKFERSTVELLRQRVAYGRMTVFVERAVLQALESAEK